MNAQQMEQRRKGIGGSDVAAILGISPWKTAYEVYLDKTGEGQQQDQTPSMSYGVMVEPVIRQWYSDRTGREVFVPDQVLVHPQHDYMLASVDGLTSEPRVLEIKTARSSQDWGEPGSDEIPPYYATQVHHYMTVTSIDVADVAVSFAGSMPVIFTIEADAEIREMLIEREHEFWQRVQRREPPDPVTYADVVQRFGKSTNAQIVANERIEQVIAWIKTLQNSIANSEKDIALCKAEVCEYMMEADTLVDLRGKAIATWKTAKPAKRFDAKTFQADEPELYSQYLTEGASSRRFLLK